MLAVYIVRLIRLMRPYAYISIEKNPLCYNQPFTSQKVHKIIFENSLDKLTILYYTKLAEAKMNLYVAIKESWRTLRL